MEEYFRNFLTILVVFWMICLSAILAEIVLYRHKLIEQYLRLSDDRCSKIIQNNEKIIKLLRLMLWLSPVYLVFVPLAIYYFTPEWTTYCTILIFLWVVSVLIEYLYTGWILEQLKPPHSADRSSL